VAPLTFTTADAPPTPDRLKPVVLIDSPVAAPTWNVTPLPSSSAMPLNLVWLEMSLISVASWPISVAMASLSSWLRVPFENCTLRSRTRWSIEVTSLREPSAVWTSETPSFELRWA
jgi:hypothetical protein